MVIQRYTYKYRFTESIPMKQTVSKQEEKKENRKDRREGKGRVLALSRHVYQLQGKDVFYVESESCDNRYYFVRFNSCFAGEFCSCKDFDSNRTERCKHLYGVEYAIRFNTIKAVDKLPEEVRKGKNNKEEEDKKKNTITATATETNYENESIGSLNDLEQAMIEEEQAREYRTKRLSYESDYYSF